MTETNVISLKTEDAEYLPPSTRRRFAMKLVNGKRQPQYVTVKHEIGPKRALLNRLGPISPNLAQFANIIVAVYQPPGVEKTDGGILLPTSITEEDVEEYLWQGKVGLIIAMGPQAYEDDETVKFHGTRNNVGDWVWFRPSDGVACEINGVFCRKLRERDIIGRLAHPDEVW